MTLYEQLLLFPKRAEYLEQNQYQNYRVRLEHWRELSSTFLEAFKAVYERQDAAVLLVHGAQGTGKTLFCQQLEKGFEQARQQTSSAQFQPQADNLWHTLVSDRLDAKVIQTATLHTTLQRVQPEVGWLDKERQVARHDPHRVRLFVMDDVHRDAFIREWSGLSQGEYVRLRADGKVPAALSSVAQQLVQDCRGDFQRSIFLLLSNNAEMMAQLKLHLDESHRGLATLLELPLPPPALKEEIVRTNTNRFNRVSYWACLDRGGPEEKRAVYRVLQGSGGFTDSFEALGRALGSEDAERRLGRPANKNLITLVTLGTDPDTARAFMEDHELAQGGGLFEHYHGKHLGVWLLPDFWGSMLDMGRDANLTRRAGMVESEFGLRWVTVDMLATYALLRAEPAPGDLGERLLDIIRFFPSIAKPREIGKHRQLSQQLDADLEKADWRAEDVAGFEQWFRQMGQRRSAEYEPALRKRIGAYGQGFQVYPAVRPDLVADEYTPCAVTRAASDNPKAIESAIRRTCHAIEFTAHLQPDMKGLIEYILGKLERYAEMLESV